MRNFAANIAVGIFTFCGVALAIAPVWVPFALNYHMVHDLGYTK